MSAANRRRGADAERKVVAYLRENGYPDARRYLAGDGRQPGDIDAIPGVAIEVKDRKASSWPSWMAQALAEAGPDRIAVVVRRTRGNPRVGEWECRWFDPMARSVTRTRCYPVDGRSFRWSIDLESMWFFATFADFLAWLTVEGAA